MASGDDDSDFASQPSDVSSSSVCEDCDDASSSSVTPKSSDSETSVSSSSSVKYSSSKGSSSSSEQSSSSAVSSSSVPEGYVDPSTVVTGTMTDERDGQTYKTVTIGTQTWMAENLNYETAKSYCYGDNVTNCAKYGRLYTWAAAMDSAGTWTTNGLSCGYSKTCLPTYPVRGVCPEGWHLPTQMEWNTLFTAVGGQSTAGLKLKSSPGWNSRGNGTDAFGFSALPAGDRSYNGNYDNEGVHAIFWSSSEGNGNNAYEMCLIYDYDSARPHYYDKDNGFSVRCVKD